MNMKGRKIITRLIFLVGFIICCYPLVSSLLERQHLKGAVSTYQESVSEKDKSDIEAIFEKAHEYNSMLFQSNGASVDGMQSTGGVLSDENYNSILSQGETGIMGSIEIPKIGVDLPIYHGTSDEVLSNGVGHVQDSSLPVGGESTRCVLTGHRGLPNSKLFTRLDEIKKGDLFFLNVFGETLAYKVNDIQVIEPEEVDVLNIEEGKDLVSLITCTPYGLNTHRLVVTGERVEYEKAKYENIQESLPSWREILFAVLPFAFLGVAVAFYIKDRRAMKNETKNIKK